MMCKKISVVVMPSVYIAANTEILSHCVNPVTGCKNTKGSIVPKCYSESEINTCFSQDSRL